MAIYTDLEKSVDDVLARVGKTIVFGMPLGLGKPVHFCNALYARAKQDPSISLHIISAIALEKPGGKSPLEKSFLGPVSKRLFDGIPDIEYVKDFRARTMPDNIKVSEFYFKPGSFLRVDEAQQNYISSNYTHAARDLVDNGLNVVAQMVGKRVKDGKTELSLGSNPDLSLDMIMMLHERFEKTGEPFAVVGQVNTEMPFMINDALIEPDQFEILLDEPSLTYPLFGAPNMAVVPTDHMIGFNASLLVKDGGTLQVGIGSLGGALMASIRMREKNNKAYNDIIKDLQVEEKFPVIKEIGESDGYDKFDEGLYGCSEMFVDSFIHLYHDGVIKRKVYQDVDLQTLINEKKISETISGETLDALLEAGRINAELGDDDLTFLQKFGIFRPEVTLADGMLAVNGESISANLADSDARDQILASCLGDKLKGGVVIHGGFFLGPREFYQILRDLTDEQQEEICMTSVGFINHLYDHFLGSEKLKIAQRAHARFINTCMIMTLTGGAASDALENGQVVSGVGGQYNFVAQAHDMPGARSVLILKSCRPAGGGVKSNILFNYGYTTIPKHLRDVVVTEYGIADLRGKSDRDCMIALIKIADSRFQQQLLEQAKEARKIPADYELPAEYCNNTPERLAVIVKKYQEQGLFDPFPFGCDFTEDELVIGRALKMLKAKTGGRKGKLAVMKAGLGVNAADLKSVHKYLVRMDLDNPQNFKEKLTQRILAAELVSQGAGQS